MKIKMLSRMAGPERILNPGDVADLPKDFAQELIRGKYAESAEAPVKPLGLPEPDAKPVFDGDNPESAAMAPPENAAANPDPAPRRPGGRGRKV